MEFEDSRNEVIDGNDGSKGIALFLKTRKHQHMRERGQLQQRSHLTAIITKLSKNCLKVV